MELRVLRYFLEVARVGSITHAAERLHISQPTLSRQLKALEEELGKKLFVRSNYSVRLTEEGLLLRERAEDIVAMVDKTEAEFQALDEIGGGDIRVGCAESQGLAAFMRVVRTVQRRYPAIRFHFYSSGTEAATERLDRGLLDFAIIVQSVDDTKYNHLRLPVEDRWGVLMRRDDPLAAKAALSRDDLRDLPLILSRQAMREELAAWFGDDQERLHIAATYDLLFNTSLMVREGLGYALGFEGLVHTEAESDLCFRPLSPPLTLVWRKHQRFTPAAALFKDALEKTFGDGKCHNQDDTESGDKDEDARL